MPPSDRRQSGVAPLDEWRSSRGTDSIVIRVFVISRRQTKVRFGAVNEMLDPTSPTPNPEMSKPPRFGADFVRVHLHSEEAGLDELRPRKQAAGLSKQFQAFISARYELSSAPDVLCSVLYAFGSAW